MLHTLQECCVVSSSYKLMLSWPFLFLQHLHELVHDCLTSLQLLGLASVGMYSTD